MNNSSLTATEATNFPVYWNESMRISPKPNYWIVVFVIFITLQFQSGFALSQQNIIWTKISGKIVGGSIRYNGVAKLNLISRNGKITGKLNNGIKCHGRIKINLFFSKGSGHLYCTRELSGKFNFELLSRIPTHGTGGGILKDGRTVTFNISPY